MHSADRPPRHHFSHILISEQLNDPLGRLILVDILLTCILITYLIMNVASILDRYLTHTRRSMLTRLFGLILAALSVQIISYGVKGLWF